MTPIHQVEDLGGGPGEPVVVIVHGAMDRSASFGRVARQLREVNLVRYDRRGYGRSHGLGVGMFHDHLADLFDVIAERPTVLFGHSFGGVLALAAAQHRPDLVRSVLAYEAPAPWASWWPPGRSPGTDPRIDPDPEAAAESFMRRAIGDRYWDRLGAQTRSARRAEGGALLADLASLRGDRPFDPASVTVPVVSAYGAQTTWWHARAAQELAADVPHGAAAVVPDAGHGVHLSHPSATAELIRRAVALAGEPRPT